MTLAPKNVDSQAYMVQPGKPRLGFFFVLILVYLWVEYARPANPMGIPMAISLLLFVGWVAQGQKVWRPQIVCFFLLLGAIGVMGPFAVNTFAIFWGFRNLAVQLLCIAIPIAHFVDSSRKVSVFVNSMIAVSVYIAIHGITHGGRGPGGHVGDENDLALALNVMIPYAFVSIFVAKSFLRKSVFVAAFSLMTLGVMFTFSRGGFLGLLAALGYCFFLLPRKMPAIALGILLAIGAWMYAPEGYWEEMATISQDARETDRGTGALRREFWRVATRMFLANPVFGVGMNNYTWNVNQYQSAEQMQHAGRSYAGNVAHSLYFTVLAELGLAGTLLFAAIAWYNLKDTTSVIRSVRGAKLTLLQAPLLSHTVDESELRHDLDRLQYYAHGVHASLLGFAISSAFLTTFSYPHFWVLTALAVACRRIAEETIAYLPEQESVPQQA